MVSVAGEQKARGQELERKVEKEVLRKTSRVQTGQPGEGGVPFIRPQGQVKSAGRKRMKPVLGGFRYLGSWGLDSVVKQGHCVKAVNATLRADEGLLSGGLRVRASKGN